MSVLCYFPWNLRLQSAVRLLFPILPEDIIHPVSWLKSGSSARLDNLDLRTYAFPFKKVNLCLETVFCFCSCSFAALESEIFHRICGNFYSKEICVTDSCDNYIPTVVFLIKFFLFTYFSISSFRVQTNRFFLLLFLYSMTKPRCSNCLKISKLNRPTLTQRLSCFTLEKTSQLCSLPIAMLLIFFSFPTLNGERQQNFLMHTWVINECEGSCTVSH